MNAQVIPAPDQHHPNIRAAVATPRADGWGRPGALIVAVAALLGLTPLATAQTTFLSGTDWSDPAAWSAGRPDTTTEARIVDSLIGDTAIQLPGVNEAAATARSLTVYDVNSIDNQNVSLQNGTLNLTPASVFDTALRVGLASMDGAHRTTYLRLQNVSLSSSGFAEIGKGVPAGAGGVLVGNMDLLAGSHWLHQAGLIEIGGGDGKGELYVGSGGLLAGSLFPGAGMDPQVHVNTSSWLLIAEGGTARLSEISVGLGDGVQYYNSGGLSVKGALETNRLVVEGTSAAGVNFNSASTSSVGDVSIRHGNREEYNRGTDVRIAGTTVHSNSITVHDGIIWLSEYHTPGDLDLRRSDLTIGSPDSQDGFARPLKLVGAAGIGAAKLYIEESDVTVHGSALLGGYDNTLPPDGNPRSYGDTVVDITTGGLLDIRGKATVGEVSMNTADTFGVSTVNVTGANSIFRVQNLEAGYSESEYRSQSGDPLPIANLNIGSGGRIEVAGESRTSMVTSPYGSYSQTEHFAGRLNIGKNSTLDLLDGTGKVAFADPSNGGTLNGEARLTNYGTIRGGGTTASDLVSGGHIDFGDRGGTLVNNGTIDVGHSPGWLTLNGDLTFQGIFGSGGRLKIELGGTRAGLDYDVFDIWGDADFTGGILELSLINGYNPLATDFWDFLRVRGTATGWFTTVIDYTGLNFDFSHGFENGVYRLSVSNSIGGGGGGGSVPDGGTTGLMLAATLLGLALGQARRAGRV